jgi:DNA-directed RNA polymerase subunit H (RpoH/RPB5)
MSSAIETLCEILVEQRGWRAVLDAPSPLTFLDRAGRRRTVHVFSGSVNVEMMRRVIAGAAFPDGAPVVVGDSITSVFSLDEMEFIPLDMLLLNPFKHEMVPQYEVVGAAFQDGMGALKMSASDPIAVLLGLRPGDVVVARPKPTMSKCTPRETVRVIGT